MIWRSRKYLNGARGQSCVRCGRPDAVSAHYTGLRQHQYGKGRGIKGSDILVADLCTPCHNHFDAPLKRKSLEDSEDFLHCIALTLMRRIEQGILGVV